MEVMEAPIKGAAVMDIPLEQALLRAANATDVVMHLNDLVVVPGGVTAIDDVLAESQAATQWTIGPLAEHRKGIWAERGMATLTTHAENQLAVLLHAPRPFIKDMPGKLQMAVLNWALRERAPRETALLRLNGNGNDSDWRLRALLSERYSAIDDHLVFDELRSVLTDYPEARLDRIEMQDTFTRLALSFETVDLGDSAGRIGIVVTNSEVERAALKVEAYALRLVCMNGLVANTKDNEYRFTHAGQGGRDMRATLQGAVYGSIEQARNAATTLAKATQHPLLDPLKELASVARKESISQKELDAWISSFEMEPKETVSGVVNAITRHAQNFTDELARHARETMAGDYLMERMAA